MVGWIAVSAARHGRTPSPPYAARISFLNLTCPHSMFNSFNYLRMLCCAVLLLACASVCKCVLCLRVSEDVLCFAAPKDQRIHSIHLLHPSPFACLSPASHPLHQPFLSFLSLSSCMHASFCYVPPVHFGHQTNQTNHAPILHPRHYFRPLRRRTSHTFKRDAIRRSIKPPCLSQIPSGWWGV